MASNKMVKRIKSYMEDYKLRHVVEGEVITFTTFDGDSEFTISAKDSWEDIKKQLDNFKEMKRRGRESNQCPICMRTNLCEGAAGCSSCCNSLCIDCFLSNLRARRGNWVCPFCRQDTCSNEFDDPEELEGFIQFMHQNLKRA